MRKLTVRAYVGPATAERGQFVVVLAEARGSLFSSTRFFHCCDGGPVVKYSLEARSAVIDTANYAPGVYCVNVHAEQGFRPEQNADTKVWFEVR